jgi:hypothetical protein
VIESITGFFSALKGATPQILFGIALATGILVFGSPTLLAALGLKSVIEAYRAIAGAVFLIASCILLAQAVWWFGKSLTAPFHWLLRMKRRTEVLRNLTPDEKAYLVRYIQEQQNTQYFRIDDGIAMGLAAKGVIYRPAQVGDLYDGFAFNLSEWSRRALSRDTSLLAGSGKLPDVLPGGAAAW